MRILMRQFPLAAILLCLPFIIKAQDITPFQDSYPLRYQRFISISLSDEYRLMDTLCEKGIFPWEGKMLHSLSDPDYKVDGKCWFAQMQVPFGKDATLFSTRWDDQSWIRGVEGQLKSASTGEVLWKGPLTFVDGGDGGTIERSTILHDLDRDGVLDMVMYEYEWYYDYSQQDSLGMGTREEERLWVLCLHNATLDSIPLALTPLTRELFVYPRHSEYLLDRVIPTDSLASLSHGRLTRTSTQRCFLVLRKGDLMGDDFAWKGTGIREEDLGKGMPNVRTPEGSGPAVFFFSVAEAQAHQRALPAKLRQHSCVVLQDACKDAETTGELWECDCIQ